MKKGRHPNPASPALVALSAKAPGLVSIFSGLGYPVLKAKSKTPYD